MKSINIRNKVLALLAPVALCVGFIGSAVAANDVPTPDALKGGKVISAEEAMKLSNAKEAAFFDARTPISFGKGRVPGATHIAFKEKSDRVPNFDASQDKFDLSKLPTDKNAKIVFYGHGTSGWKGYKAAVMSVSSGYKNAMFLRGGYAEWVAKGYPEEK